MGVAVDYSGHQGEHIRATVSEREERDASNAGRNTHLLHHVRQSDTEVAISRRGQDVNDKHEDQQPADRKSDLLPAHRHAILEIQVIEEASLIRASHFFAVVLFLFLIPETDSDHNLVGARVVLPIAKQGVVESNIVVVVRCFVVELHYTSRSSKHAFTRCCRDSNNDDK